MLISDWSSDVCSSDLDATTMAGARSFMRVVLLGFQLCFQLSEPLGETFILLARLGSHQLDRLEFFAADEIDAAKRFLHPLACGIAGLAGHACEGACGAVGQFYRSVERRGGKECVSTCRSRC